LDFSPLDLPDAKDQRWDALVKVHFHNGKKSKVNVGYHFTDFSDDLTDLDLDGQARMVLS